MGSKSKRRHAQKQYNRAQNKPPVPQPAVTAPADDTNTEPTSAAPILTAKELRQQEKARRKQEKLAKKQQAKTDKTKKTEKKPFFLIRFFKWIGRCCAEIVSELKKVHWPTFKQTMKATGIVLGIVILFGILLFGIWGLFGWLHSLLIGG